MLEARLGSGTRDAMRWAGASPELGRCPFDKETTRHERRVLHQGAPIPLRPFLGKSSLVFLLLFFFFFLSSSSSSSSFLLLCRRRRGLQLVFLKAFMRLALRRGGGKMPRGLPKNAKSIEGVCLLCQGVEKP